MIRLFVKSAYHLFETSVRVGLGRCLPTTGAAGLLFGLLVLLECATPAQAQVTARMKGTIMDPSGAGVPSGP